MIAERGDMTTHAFSECTLPKRSEVRETVRSPKRKHAKLKTGNEKGEKKC